MHPTKIVLIYKGIHVEGIPEPIRPRLVTATIAYNDEEVEKIEKEWFDKYHSVDVMDIDYSIRGE